MVKVGPLCVDKYEASIWSNPDGTGTQYGYPFAPDYLSSSVNLPVTNPNGDGIYAVSKPDVYAARSVRWIEAQQACANSGKRLLTNAEWQMAAAGTPDPGDGGNGTTTCNTKTNDVVLTGTTGNCQSRWGVYDMVGNLWEYVADWMHGSNTPWAPSSAGTTYSQGVNSGGDTVGGINAVSATDTSPAVVVRGGAWSNGTKAGIYAITTKNSLSGYGNANAVGFRCAR
jgi:formylglycine-generating enzyme required for sulfatase activity